MTSIRIFDEAAVFKLLYIIDRVQAAGLNNEIADVSEQRLHRRFHFIVLDKISIILLFSYSLYFEGVNP